MDVSTQLEVQDHIACIIDRSRHHEELFLVDSKTAAKNIIIYLIGKQIIPAIEKEDVEH